MKTNELTSWETDIKLNLPSEAPHVETNRCAQHAVRPLVEINKPELHFERGVGSSKCGSDCWFQQVGAPRGARICCFPHVALRWAGCVFIFVSLKSNH